MKKIFCFAALFFLYNNLAFASSKNVDRSQKVAQFIDKIGHDIIEIAKNKNLSDDTKKDNIIKRVDSSIDSNWIARFVLGKNYRKFSDDQKSQFKELYRQFMINTYGPKFKDYNGKEFNVLKVEKQRIFYVAKCEFVPLDSEVAISVDFRVRDRKGKLKIIDFVAEGVSLIESQRSEYRAAISKVGIDKFLQDFANKVRKLKS